MCFGCVVWPLQLDLEPSSPFDALRARTFLMYGVPAVSTPLTRSVNAKKPSGLGRASLLGFGRVYRLLSFLYSVFLSSSASIISLEPTESDHLSSRLEYTSLQSI